MVEVLRILYDAFVYCVKATAELFWLGLKWLLYDIPIFIKDNFGEEPYGLQVIEPSVDDIQEPSAGKKKDLATVTNIRALPKDNDEGLGNDEPGEGSNLDRFLTALGLSDKKAA